MLDHSTPTSAYIRPSRTNASSVAAAYVGLEFLLPAQSSPISAKTLVVSQLSRGSRGRVLSSLLPSAIQNGASAQPSRLQTISRTVRRTFRTASIQTFGPSSFVSTVFGFKAGAVRVPLQSRSSFSIQHISNGFKGDFETPSSLVSPASATSELSQRFPVGWSNGFALSEARSPFSDLHNLFSFFSSTPVHFTALNALSLTAFAFNRERRASATSDKSESRKAGPSAKTANLFLQQIEGERASRFQRAAIRIPDLVRLSFVSVYLKKPQVLANLFASTLGHLPRNRKETQFLRFLRKLVKVFTAQRKERRGVRLRFQGRVNRWRRTKHRQTERGKLNLFTYTTRLEYGTAQAITRKGAIGIRLWFCYHASWGKSHRSALFSFFRAQSF